MIRATSFAIALAVAGALGTVAHPARAEAPSAKALPVYVLSISTDDSDDQADALTEALRARVRTGRGWSVLDSPQSFDMLAIGLKCPAKPDAACLQRIGDQLHADHFIWGTMKKKGGQVTATVHMWSRGTGDESSVESYSDNLKDPSDDSLRKVANKVFTGLSGNAAPSSGTLVVHAGHEGGDVLVDGTKQGTLQGGVASLEVAAGAHTVTVQVPGFQSPAQNPTVSANAETDLTFRLASANGGEGGEGKPFPLRPVLTYTALGVGGALVVVSAVTAGLFASDSIQSNNDLSQVPKGNGDVCSNQNTPQAEDACQKHQDGLKVSTIAWVTGSIGGVVLLSGIYLLLTDDHKDSSPAASSPPSARRVEVLPTVGTRGASLDLKLSF